MKNCFHGAQKCYDDSVGVAGNCYFQILIQERFQLLVESAGHGNRYVSVLVGASSEVAFPYYP